MAVKDKYMVLAKKMAAKCGFGIFNHSEYFQLNPMRIGNLDMFTSACVFKDVSDCKQVFFISFVPEAVGEDNIDDCQTICTSSLSLHELADALRYVAHAFSEQDYRESGVFLLA